ncbi:MAG TPA: hypothetical protein VHX14_11990, partial [Thermoanaerobaculia bacterium]|nr:hypothetical protein [Thermoanaerobaculia bacterium]
DNVLGTWDIERHVVRIAQIAGETSTLRETPLLKAFTDHLISANRGNNASRALSTYLALEAYFQQLVEIQFKGLGLVAAAMCWDVRDEAKARSITKDFLAQVSPHFKKEADLFVQCADEIVMAIFTDKPTRFLGSPAPTTPAPVIVKIARRANVLRTLVYAAVGSEPATVAGIHGTVYGRIADTEADRERTLSMPPWGSSKGTEIGPLARADAPIEWEVSSDRQTAKLREKSKSGFRAIHYFLPWSAWQPPMDRPLTSDFGGVVARWYDLDTLEEVDKGGENRVIIADFCDMRFLQGADVSGDGLVSKPPFGQTTDNNQNRIGLRNDEKHGIHAIRADQTPYRLLAKGTLEAHMAYNFPQGGPVGYDLIFALFRYNGPEAKLLFTWDMKMSLKLLENVWPSRGGADATMRMSPRGKVDLLRKRDGEPDEATPLYGTDWNHSLWAQFTGAHSEDRRRFTVDVVLKNTDGKEDAYSLLLHFDVVNDLGRGGFTSSTLAKGSIEYEIKDFRIAWK